MTTGTKNCENYKDLLISRHVLKDISRTNGEKLDRHLKRCESCRREEQKLLLLHRASLALPEMETSRSFERKLFKKLDIPKHKPARGSSRFALFMEKFDLLGGRLKPAAAFLSVIFIQFVLVRAYFLNDGMKDRNMAAGTDIGLVAEPRRESSPLARRLEDTLAGKNLRTTVDAKVRTVRIPVRHDAERKRPAPASSGKTMRKKSETDLKKESEKNKNLDDIGTSRSLNARRDRPSPVRKKDTTVSRRRSTSGAGTSPKKSADPPAGTRNANGYSGSLRGMTNSNTVAPGNDKTAQNRADDNKASDPRKRSVVRFAQSARKPLRTTPAVTKPRYRKETRITVTLNTPAAEEKKVRAVTPHLRRQLKRIYGGNSRIAFRYTRLPETRNETPKTAVHADPSRNTTALLLLAVTLELALRIILLFNLKRSGRLTHGNLAAAALLGSLSLPWFLFRKD